MKSLMESDHAAYVRLTELSHLLHSSDLDIRQLGGLRSVFKVEEDGSQSTTTSVGQLKAKLESIYSPHRFGEQIVSKVLGFLVDSEQQETVELIKLNNMIDFVLCHPTIVKRNKNTSAGMELVMQEQTSKNTNQDIAKQTTAFLEFNQEN